MKKKLLLCIMLISHLNAGGELAMLTRDGRCLVTENCSPDTVLDEEKYKYVDATSDEIEQAIAWFKTREEESRELSKYAPLVASALAGLNAQIFKGLTSFTCPGQSISYLEPMLLAELSTLKVCDLSDNSISYIPPGFFDGAPNIRNINVSNNRIIRLPRSLFKKLKKIRTVLLQNNELTTFPAENLAQFSCLEEVNVSDNYMTDEHISSVKTLFQRAGNSQCLTCDEQKTVDESGRSQMIFTLTVEHAKKAAHCLKEFLGDHLDVNMRNADENSLLNECIKQSRRYSVIPYLISRRAEPFAKDTGGNNALHTSVQAQRDAISFFLCSRFPGLMFERNEQGQTPLCCASENHNPEIVELFAKITKKHRLSFPQGLLRSALLLLVHNVPLDRCYENRICDLLSELIKLRYDILQMDDSGQTLLHHAARSGLARIVSLLIKHNPDSVNMFDAWGKHALWYAVENRQAKVVTVCADAGARVALTSPAMGDTMLHVAVRNQSNGNRDATGLIIGDLIALAPGALEVKNNDGVYPHECAGGKTRSVLSYWVDNYNTQAHEAASGFKQAGDQEKLERAQSMISIFEAALQKLAEGDLPTS